MGQLIGRDKPVVVLNDKQKLFDVFMNGILQQIKKIGRSKKEEFPTMGIRRNFPGEKTFLGFPGGAKTLQIIKSTLMSKKCQKVP